MIVMEQFKHILDQSFYFLIKMIMMMNYEFEDIFDEELKLFDDSTLFDDEDDELCDIFLFELLFVVDNPDDDTFSFDFDCE